MKIPLDNSVILSFEAFNLSGGQYKKLFGRTVGPTCDVLYEESLKKTVSYFFSKTNMTITHGVCPIEAQVIEINNWTPDDLGDYLPPYVPGNERWRLDVYLSKNGEVLGGNTYYAILRDAQKLIEGKW